MIQRLTVARHRSPSYRIMTSIYRSIQQRAREIVARFPRPRFYDDCDWAVQASQRIFDTHPRIKDIHRIAARHLKDDFGHGLRHAVKVTLDAGALVLAEYRDSGLERRAVNQQVLLVQSAGLLHDIKRTHKNHALRGAESARALLAPFPFTPAEVETICRAIENHTAFKSQQQPPRAAPRCLISDCLYDADKFRWGPDNFTDTVWEMITSADLPLDEFIRRYPRGMEGIARIGKTFRSRTGREYGPGFIKLGLSIGDEIYHMILDEFIPQSKYPT